MCTKQVWRENWGGGGAWKSFYTLVEAAQHTLAAWNQNTFDMCTFFLFFKLILHFLKSFYTLVEAAQHSLAACLAACKPSIRNQNTFVKYILSCCMLSLICAHFLNFTNSYSMTSLEIKNKYLMKDKILMSCSVTKLFL